MNNENNNFKGYQVTAHCRPKYSRGHNLRLPGFVDNQKHIDKTRPHRVILDLGDELESFTVLFTESIEKYNKTQKRKDRRLTPEKYLNKILEDGREGKHKNIKADASRKPIYEMIFYLGNRKSHLDDKKAEKIMELFVTKIIPLKFPNIKPILIAEHNDEFSFDRKGNRIESPCHFHVDFVYVAHALTKEERDEEYKIRESIKKRKQQELKDKGIEWNEELWKEKNWRPEMIERWGKSLETGIETQCSMSAACAEMGFYTQNGKGTAQQQLEMEIKNALEDFAQDLGVKIDRSRGIKHKHKEKDDYIEETNLVEVAHELSDQQVLIKAEKLLLQDQQDDFDYKIEQVEDEQKRIKREKKKLIKIKEELDLEKKVINEKIDEINKKTIELNAKEDLQKEKELKLNQLQYDVETKKEELNQKEADLSDREKKVDQEEGPLLEMLKKIDIQNEELKKNSIIIEEKKQNLEEIAMRLVNKENDLEKMQQKINKQKEEIQTEKDLIEQTQKALTKKIEQVKQQEVENNKIYNEYIDEINKYNDSFTEKSLKIEEWENASTMISDVEPFLKKEFSDYSKNRNIKNSLSLFYQNIKKGIEGFITKTKKLYDGLINDFKKKFFGYDYEDKNGRLIHFFGTQELSNMFLEGNKETFINIAKDMEKYNAKTFSDLCQKNQNTLPKHFEYAREIERKLERNQEISR